MINVERSKVYDVMLDYIYDKKNLLEGITPKISNSNGESKIKMEFFGRGETEEMYRFLTDDMDPVQHTDIFSSDLDLVYDLKESKPIDDIIIIGYWSYPGRDYTISEFELYLSETDEEAYNPNNKIYHYVHDEDNYIEDDIEKRAEATFHLKFQNCKGRYLGVRIIKANPLDDIIRLSCVAAYSDERLNCNDNAVSCEHNKYIKIFDEVIESDFYGVGANCIPSAMMQESINRGYNRALWEIDRKRIVSMGLPLARLWFQIDWFVDSGEDYISGNYNFDSEYMKSVYLYLDALKEAGTEIELNYSWKVSYKASEWFSYPSDMPDGSAPKDMISYAKACSALLKELWVRGYTNIKYLTLYNEPINTHDFRGPFADNSESAHYYRVLIDFVDWQLRKDGIRDKIQLWGNEGGWLDEDIDYLTEIEGESSSPLEVLTFHRYDVPYDFAVEFFGMISKKFDKPLCMTEHGIKERLTNWHTNMPSVLIAAANNGIRGICNWILCDTVLTDPRADFEIEWKNNFWGGMYNKDSINKVYGNYYYNSLIAKYIPNHSKVMKSETSDENIRAATFTTSEGDITVITVLKDSDKTTSLSIDLPYEVNKVFYKHIVSLNKHYTYFDYKEDCNALIPLSVGEIYATDKIIDELDGNFNFVVYTTKVPAKQVAMNSIYEELKPGEEFCFKAEILDGTGELEWSVCYGKGYCNNDGIVKIPSNALVGETFTVMAKIKDSNEYGVAVVKVV